MAATPKPQPKTREEDFAAMLGESKDLKLFHLEDIENQIFDRIRPHETVFMVLRDILEISPNEISSHLGIEESEYKRYERQPETFPLGILMQLSSFYTKVCAEKGWNIIVPPSIFQFDEGAPAPLNILKSTRAFLQTCGLKYSDGYKHACAFFFKQMAAGRELAGKQDSGNKTYERATASATLMDGAFKGITIPTLTAAWGKTDTQDVLERYLDILHRHIDETRDAIKQANRDERTSFAQCLRIAKKFVGEAGKYNLVNGVIEEIDYFFKERFAPDCTERREDPSCIITDRLCEMDDDAMAEAVIDNIPNLEKIKPKHYDDVRQFAKEIRRHYATRLHKAFLPRLLTNLQGELKDFNEMLDCSSIEQCAAHIDNFRQLGSEHGYKRAHEDYQKYVKGYNLPAVVPEQNTAIVAWNPTNIVFGPSRKPK